MTQYILEIPKVDSSLPWHRVKVFDSKSDAVKYSDNKLGTDNGCYCMLSYDGKNYMADTIHPNLSLHDNPHLKIKTFLRHSNFIDSVRDMFPKGNEVYPGAGFLSQNHIQLGLQNFLR